MIGSKVSQMILDNKQLNFYKYDSDVKELLGNVRDSINEVCPSFHDFACIAKTFSHADHAGTLTQRATHLQPAMLCLLWPCQRDTCSLHDIHTWTLCPQFWLHSLRCC